jgi:hypothetical protein
VLIGLQAGAQPLLAPLVADRVDALYSDAIADAVAQDGEDAVDAGIAIGSAVAAAMLDRRADDGRYPDPLPRFPESDDIGRWRPEIPSFSSDPNAFVADVDTFSVISSSQFRTKGPHELTSGAYAREYAEVKALGGDGVTTPHARTDEQEAVAAFFTTNPVELWNRTFRSVADAEGLDPAEQAHLLALANMSGADAHINCWDDKRHWSFWRPLTAIRAGDADANRSTDPDPTWTPRSTTPPYPEHPSGYNCVTAAFMHTAERYFRGPVEFDVVRVATGVPDQTRRYDRFTDVVRDAIEARILQGIHFRASDVQGADIGRRVARWVSLHEFGIDVPPQH